MQIVGFLMRRLNYLVLFCIVISLFDHVDSLIVVSSYNYKRLPTCIKIQALLQMGNKSYDIRLRRECVYFP